LSRSRTKIAPGIRRVVVLASSIDLEAAVGSCAAVCALSGLGNRNERSSPGISGVAS
jgi:hypothetical protein